MVAPKLPWHLGLNHEGVYLQLGVALEHIEALEQEVKNLKTRLEALENKYGALVRLGDNMDGD